MTYLVPLLLSVLIPLFLVAAILFVLKQLRERDERRSPLTEKLHYGPGEQLRRNLEKVDEAISEALTLTILVGPLVLCSWALQQIDWAKARFGINGWILAIFFVAVLAWTVRKLVQQFAKRRRLRAGLAAELMTAQLLMPLASKGCQVLHDIPADGFNLDHVVIGTHAVYMVETKSRMKPGTGQRSARVSYDGKRLHFPDHATSQPLDQARHEARWLAKYLHEAVGESVRVFPVVALPGWYVDQQRGAHEADVIVLNPKMHFGFTDSRHGALIGDSLRRRVVHALVQRYPATE